MASTPKKMKITVGHHDRAIVIDLTQAENEIEIPINLNIKQEKIDDEEDESELDINVNKDWSKLDIEVNKDVTKLDVMEPLGKKYDIPITATNLIDSNNNEQKLTGKERPLELLPWKPNSFSGLMKKPEETVPIEEVKNEAVIPDLRKLSEKQVPDTEMPTCSSAVLNPKMVKQ